MQRARAADAVSERHRGRRDALPRFSVAGEGIVGAHIDFPVEHVVDVQLEGPVEAAKFPAVTKKRICESVTGGSLRRQDLDSGDAVAVPGEVEGIARRRAGGETFEAAFGEGLAGR